jgi:RND family efflux transporter MFP subunit
MVYVLLAAATLLALSSCEKPAAAALPAAPVEVVTLQNEEIPLTTEMIGQLDSPQNVELRARVEAFVDKMHFTEGTEVNQGDLLYELDKKPFLEKLAAANGSLAEANAALNKYRKDVDRLAPLAERRAIPQQDLDNALAAVEVGKAGVLSAEARVQSAQIDLGYCEVHAPVTGLIGAGQVAIGELVGKGQPTLLATISKLDPIWFYCNVSEVDYLKAESKARESRQKIESLPVTLILSDGDEHAEKGKFVFIDRAVDPKTGTLRLRAEFANSAKLLRPGMFARIRVDLGKRAECVKIPARALIDMQGKSFVWVVTPEGTASQRMIETGEQVGTDFLVTRGLVQGETLIVEGLQKIREGSPVQAIPYQAAVSAKAPNP